MILILVYLTYCRLSIGIACSFFTADLQAVDVDTEAVHMQPFDFKLNSCVSIESLWPALIADRSPSSATIFCVQLEPNTFVQEYGEWPHLVMPNGVNVAVLCISAHFSLQT
jgi:hypothetical protein